MSGYLDNFNIIKHWYEERDTETAEINTLKTDIERLKNSLEDKKTEYAKSVAAVKGADCIDHMEFLECFLQAIINTEKATYQEFLNDLTDRANEYLNKLNVDDFTGVIHIERKTIRSKEDLSITLEDKNGKIITNPNTSLATTMHISLLLAISEVSKDCGRGEYPLIFDAPTSSFDEGKDRDFYKCLDQFDKQCIVVTKSFLRKNQDTSKFEEDVDVLKQLKCPIYRIEKLQGFDKQDLTTIDTQVRRLTLN